MCLAPRYNWESKVRGFGWLNTRPQRVRDKELGVRGQPQSWRKSKFNSLWGTTSFSWNIITVMISLAYTLHYSSPAQWRDISTEWGRFDSWRFDNYPRLWLCKNHSDNLTRTSFLNSRPTARRRCVVSSGIRRHKLRHSGRPRGFCVPVGRIRLLSVDRSERPVRTKSKHGLPSVVQWRFIHTYTLLLYLVAIGQKAPSMTPVRLVHHTFVVVRVIWSQRRLYG